MKIIYEWGIPSAGFLIWIVLTLIIVPAFIRYLRKKGDRTLPGRTDGPRSAPFAGSGTPLALSLAGVAPGLVALAAS